MSARVLVIDNYDSFTYNLVQYLGELGAEPVVVRNDAIDVAGIDGIDPDAILISPGPGTPDDAGISMEVITTWGGRRPILGVCLGHQAIGQVFGASIVRADLVMHGKTSVIHHLDVGVFEGLPDPVEATRYHSLVIDPGTVPDVLEVTARVGAVDGDGTIMGVRHRELDIEGVQFHPESILTGSGHDMLRRFMARAAPAESV